MNFPTTPSNKAECFRDLARMISGGSVYVLGQNRAQPVPLARDLVPITGLLNSNVCNTALMAFSKVIGDELAVQCSSGENIMQEDPTLILAIAMRAAAHISTNVGVQVMEENNIPPVLWQPTFVVCIGSAEVWLMTLAFVGEPVTGQRPEDKCTPFVLVLASSNLMPTALTSQEELAATTRYALRPALADATMQDHLLSLNTDFFSCVKRGDWARRAESDAAPKRQIGDRASRMRALLEKRVQTPAPSQVTQNTGQSFFQTLSASFAAWSTKTRNVQQETQRQEAEEMGEEERETICNGSSRNEGSIVSQEGVSTKVPTNHFPVGDRGARLRSLFERSAHSQEFITITVG